MHGNDNRSQDSSDLASLELSLYLNGEHLDWLNEQNNTLVHSDC